MGSEEANTGWIHSPEMPVAEQSLRRISRAIPPVQTATATTSLSGLNQLVREGWQADVVIAAPTVLERRLAASTARAARRLGHLYHDSLDRYDPPRTTHRTPPPVESAVPERVYAS